MAAKIERAILAVVAAAACEFAEEIDGKQTAAEALRMFAHGLADVETPSETMLRERGVVEGSGVH